MTCMADRTRPVLAGPGWVCDGTDLIQLMIQNGVPVVVRKDLLPYVADAVRSFVPGAEPASATGDHYHLVIPIPLRVPRPEAEG